MWAVLLAVSILTLKPPTESPKDDALIIGEEGRRETIFDVFLHTRIIEWIHSLTALSSALPKLQ